MTSGHPRPGELTGFASRVLEAADVIPPGRVMSYGDIAEYLGEAGPRQVGRVMAVWGGAAPWWRVIHADGSFLRGHEREALARYQAEGTPLRRAPDGSPLRVDMSRARWTPGAGPPPASPA
ncbi:MAG: MGMT family protein [Actinobacteria bacterium]|nr:MGMT family protein [Actinomycetota bacterium]